MDCLVLLLLLCCCGGGCGNGVSGNSNGNCCCEKKHCHCHHHHHHYNHCNGDRRDCVREVNVCEETCECKEKDVCDAANMTPPTWRDFPGVARDCDCKN